MRELVYSQPVPRRERKPKGPTAQRIAKRRRAEDPVKARVRAECVERDGYCRFQLGAGYLAIVGACAQWSEWMHLEDKKRGRTRNMAPDQRHTVEKSMMGCKKHHGLYDAGDIRIAMGDAGANGPIRVETDCGVYMIPARRMDI